MLYDYYGFPPESYSYHLAGAGSAGAGGAGARAAGRRRYRRAAKIRHRGFDHGTFIPLKLTYPDAEIPTIQLSLVAGLDPAEHLAIGRALAPLRDEGVFIIGSGMTFHNLRAFRDPRAVPVAEAFDAWLRDTMSLEAAARNRRLERLGARAGRASGAHPREEHLIPLMVAAGAAGDDRATLGL